jgi:N-methylhydantoinase A
MTAFGTPAPRLVVGVDTGGTFTDVILLDAATGEVWTAKTPSTPDDPSLGFARGIAEVLEAAHRDGAGIARVLHGTTIATNLILEGKGAATALVTTAGFRYVLEIGRQDVPRRASLFAWIKPKRPIPPERIFEVEERIGPDGKVIVPLGEAGVRAAARAIGSLGVASVAVVLLHSYANPEHERRVAALLREEIPRAQISLSSSVLPVFREYERSMTTLLNASVMPVVVRYLARLEEQLAAAAITAPLLIMKSNGGVASTRSLRRAPVETALSGPAAGAVAACHAGAGCKAGDLIAIDIGGTSADITLVADGRLRLTTSGRVGDWPLGLPMVDILTIGAGGGSIARVAEGGALTVGPASAGAVPGPACYGRGGTEATVTDAHLVLGHLPPYLLGGDFPLDVAAAEKAVCRLAEPLGMEPEAAARGILAIVDSNMAGAIRVASVEQGHDPRQLALLAFGGAGGLHAGALARLLGMARIIVPPGPGVLSARGLLLSDLKAEFARTALQRAGAFDCRSIARTFAELEAQARAWLDAEGVPETARSLKRHASLRYRHQGFELFVPWEGRDVSDRSARATVAAFHRRHERLYTFAQEDTPVEIVTLRVDAAGAFPPPAARELPAGGPIADARQGAQAVAFADGRAMVPVYARGRLGAGAVIEGPAILTERDATTLLLPGQAGTIDRFGNLIVEEGSAPAAAAAG